MTSPLAPSTATAPERPGRVGWRRVVLILLVLGGAAIAVEHILGGQLSLWVLAGGAAVVLLLLGVWRFPHLMRHFHPFGLRERRTKTHTRTWSSSGRKAFKTPGSPFSGRKGSGGAGRSLLKPRSGSARRGTGSGRARSGIGRLLPGSGRRGKTGPGKSRAGGGQARKSRRAGLASGRNPGAGRRKSSPFRRSGGAKSGSRRLASAFKRKAGRSGTGRKAGTGLRRPSAALKRMRRRLGTSRKSRANAAGSRRRLFRPSTWRKNRNSPAGRKNRNSPAGRKTGQQGGKQGSRWRRLTRSGRDARRNAAAAGAAAAQTRKRFSRSRAWWQRSNGHASRLRFGAWALRHPSAWRRPANAVTRPPGRMRRGLHKLTGTPQQRHSRRAAAKAHRADSRANRIRLARNPYASRFRWYAPWRAWTKGPGARALFHRWRVNRGYVAPRGKNGRKLGWAQRASRRWNIWRGHHRGLGRAGRVPWPQRLRNAGLLRRWRTRRPPLPLSRAGQPRWMQRALGRVDRRRGNRWAQARRKNANSPLRPPSAPRPKIAVPGLARHGSAGNVVRGGKLMDTRAMADEIRSMASGEFHDANDVHDTLAGMHEIVDAVHESFSHWSNLLPEMGTHPMYAEVVQEVAGMLSGISDKLQEVTAGGVMRGPGS